MPLNFDSATRNGDILCMESDGFLAIAPDDARLTDSQWEASCAALREHSDLAAVIVVQSTDWLAKIFAEAWMTLPSRLAALAICPPAATCLVARADGSIDRVRQLAGDVPGFSLWRSLVELAKAGVRIGPRQVASSSLESDEDSLPKLLQTPPRRELDWLFSELKLARLSDLCGDVVSPADATAVLAGLWLLHGDGDASHRQSQSIEDEGRHRCGNFWHAIMHRQEPDYGNSKYWFRRVGQHPIFPELARRADELITADGSVAARRWRSKIGLPSDWDPFAFVDWCEEVSDDGDASQIALLRRIQFVEMHLLLRASFDDATRRT